jgi:hypothetical protein
MNDFRTLQLHINSLITRSEASPPDQESYYLDGYVILRQCAAESQAVLAGHFNPGSLGLQAGNVPETEVQKAALQRYGLWNIQPRDVAPDEMNRIILDASTRRFQAHKIYLRASAGIRWVQMRAQVLRGEKPAPKHANALRAVDQRLRQVRTLDFRSAQVLGSFEVVGDRPDLHNPNGHVEEAVHLSEAAIDSGENWPPSLTRADFELHTGTERDHRRARCARSTQCRPAQGLLDRRRPDAGAHAWLDSHAEMTLPVVGLRRSRESRSAS